MSFPIDIELPSGSNSLLRESLLEGEHVMHRISFIHPAGMQEVQRQLVVKLGSRGYRLASCEALFEEEIADWTVFENPGSDLLIVFTEDPLREGAYLLLSCQRHPGDGMLE